MRQNRAGLRATAVGEGYTACAAWHIVVLERQLRGKALRISKTYEYDVDGVGNITPRTCLHAGPDTRMTAIAAFPDAVDKAYIVGSSS